MIEPCFFKAFNRRIRLGGTEKYIVPLPDHVLGKNGDSTSHCEMVRLYATTLFFLFLSSPLYSEEGERTIILFGDSTTASRGSLKVYANHLEAAKFEGSKVKVINAGVPAHNTEDANARFDKDVREHKPELVVIQFGINDAAIDVWKTPPVKVSRVPLAEYRSNMSRFVRTLKADGTSVILMTPNPLRWTKKMKEMYGKPPYDPGDENGFSVPLNPYVEAMRKVAEEEEVPLVDINRRFRDYGKADGTQVDDLLLDGVHPNEKGHQLIGEALLPALKAAFASRDKEGLTKPTGLRRTHSDQWEKLSEAVTFTDMTKVTPASALSERREHNRWKVFEYETAEFSGKCLSVGRESSAPDITFADGLEGWHAVYVGLSTITDLVRPAPNMIEAGFTNEDSFLRLTNLLDLGKPRRDRVEEVFLGHTNLSEADLVFSTIHHKPARLHYVRAVPLTEREVAAIKAERDRRDTRKLIATIDGFGWIHEFRPTTRAELESAFRTFQDTDIGSWWYQPTGADLVQHPTELGTILGETLDTFPRAADRNYTESVRTMHKKGIDPMKVAMEECKKQGSDFYICLRAQGWKAAPPWEEFFMSKFYEEHPEWHCVDYDGTPTMHMSYAVEEVQDHLIDVYRECLQRGGDGVGFLFHRGLPLMLWEKPFRDRFQARYKIDPLTIPERDPRVDALRREIMNGFIGKIRKLLDEEQVRRGPGSPRLKFVSSTFARKSDNDRFGLDVEKWIENKWIDQIGIAWFAYYTSGLGKYTGDTKYYVGITEGTDVKIFPFHIGWKMPDAAELLRRVERDYQNGADGIALWDPNQFRGWLKGFHAYWPLVGRLGHRDQLNDGSLLFYPKYDPLTRMGENHYSRWYPNTGF